MRRYLLVVLLFLMTLCGCSAKSSVSDKVVVTGLGIDYRDGRYVLSIQAVETLKTAGSLSEQSETATSVYTAEGDSIAEALREFLNEAGKQAYILQNQIILISLEQCRAGSLFTTLDYFIRNQEGRTLVDLAVCREDPAALLGIVTGNDAIPAEYLSQLLEEGADCARTVRARLLDAERASSGMYDVTLPILEMRDGTPALSGTAVFRQGYLAEELNEAETTGLLIAADQAESCLYSADMGTVCCEKIGTRLTIQPQTIGWQYRFHVMVAARITEKRKALSEADRQAWISHLEKQIADDAVGALTKLQQAQADPLGLVRRTALQYRRSGGVTQRKAQQELWQSRFTVTVRVTLSDDGLLQ